MSHLDPRSVVRLSIALVALKHKSRDQSTASYLLDLQSCFPVSTEHNDRRDWRTYALELEKRLDTLKAQRDVDQELLSRLPPDVSQVTSTSDAPPPKKKSKKNTNKDQHDPDWSWDQTRADWSRILSSQYPSSPSLVAAYASLKGALAAPNADFLSYVSRLTDAILRAIDTIHHFLFSPPIPGPDAHIQSALGAPTQLKPEHIDSTRIALASPLLMYILRTVLHTLVGTAMDSTKSKHSRRCPRTTTLASADAHACVDKVLDRLLECLLLPLLRAITPLCSARLAPLVSVALKKDKTSRMAGKGKDKDKCTDSTSVDPPKMADVRTDVFALIGASLDALPPLVHPAGLSTRANGAGSSSIASGIRDRLGLETIRELEALYAVPIAVLATPLPLQPFVQQSMTTLPEPPPSTSAPISLSAQTPSQSHPRPHSHAHSQPQLQPRPQHRTAPESRAKRLERLAGTRADRVRVLATRDAGWFLASTLNLCVTPPAAGRTDTSGGLLREALLDRIGKLVRSVGTLSDAHGEHVVADHSTTDSSKFAIDPVCQDMLLAICERAVAHLVSS